MAGRAADGDARTFGRAGEHTGRWRGNDCLHLLPVFHLPPDPCHHCANKACEHALVVLPGQKPNSFLTPEIPKIRVQFRHEFELGAIWNSTNLYPSLQTARASLVPHSSPSSSGKIQHSPVCPPQTLSQSWSVLELEVPMAA